MYNHHAGRSNLKISTSWIFTCNSWKAVAPGSNGLFSTVPIILYSCIIWFLCMIFPRLIFLLHMSKAYKNSRLFWRKHQTSPHHILMMHKINLVVISRTHTRTHTHTQKDYNWCTAIYLFFFYHCLLWVLTEIKGGFPVHIGLSPKSQSSPPYLNSSLLDNL